MVEITVCVELIWRVCCRDKARVSQEASERHANADKSLAEMKMKNQVLQAEVDSLNATDRYGNLATIKSNEKRIAQTNELIEKQVKIVTIQAVPRRP